MKKLITMVSLSFLASCAAEQKSAPSTASEESFEREEAASVPAADGEGGSAKAEPKLVVAQQVSGVDELVKRHRTFTFDLHKALPTQNVVYSPHSISTVLEALYAGAAGSTADQMQQVMHISGESSQSHNRALSDALREREKASNGLGFRLRVANNLWAQTGYKLNTEYLRTAENDFQMSPQLLNFGDSEIARQTINKNISDATEARIPELIPSGVISAQTRVVLTNAVYFNAPWRVPFQVEATRDDRFTPLKGEAVTVPFMEQNNTVGHYRTDSLQAIELPYAGNNVVAVIVLPDDGKFEDVDASMSAARLAQIMSMMSAQRIGIRLPRFKARTQIDLVPTMRLMGMTEAFDERTADFSKMTAPGSESLYVSAFLHEGFIQVDEAGTEAAAASAAIMTTRGLPAPPEVFFEANRPFTFYIVDKPTGEILFVTRMINPAG